jgi:hypothetical protein
MNVTTRWLVNFFPLAKRQARLSGWLAGVCMLSLFALLSMSMAIPLDKALSQEPVVAMAMDAALTLEAELADAEERRHPEEMARSPLSRRHHKPSSRALMLDDWCGPLWLRPPIAAV